MAADRTDAQIQMLMRQIALLTDDALERKESLRELEQAFVIHNGMFARILARLRTLERALLNGGT